MFNKESKEDKFIPYLEKEVSEETRALIKGLSEANPKIRDELFNKTKNAMMSTIYSKKQSRDYIEGVVDTLKFISKYF